MIAEFAGHRPPRAVFQTRELQMSGASGAQPRMRIPSVRLSPDNATVLQNLELLADLAGHWHGHGFNLIARPNREEEGNLFLELNQTDETLDITPISSAIPNRGFLQGDIELFGLHYLQQISDSVTGGALHIEPGLWVRQPETSNPAISPPPGGNVVARMGTIPHGTSLLAQGSAIEVPELTGGTFEIQPVDTAPFPVGGTMPPGGTMGGFPPYNLSDNSAAAANFRTPFGNVPAIPLPPAINGVPMQTVVNDPTRLLQQAIQGQFIEKMVVISIATVASLNQNPPHPVTDGAGGIENMPWLLPNADAAEFFATFWIETIRQGSGSFLQLQYVQTILLNFPVLSDPTVNLSWPHVSIATLRRTFG
jgi:hypothetical protein